MRNGKNKYRLLAVFCIALFMTAAPCSALTLNPFALEAAMWKQNTIASLSYTETMFRLLLTAASVRKEYPTVEDVNKARIGTERDKKTFAEMAGNLVSFDENVLDNVVEINWIVPTERGLTFYLPEDMDSQKSFTAIIKVKIPGYKRNKFYDLALSGIKQSRIITVENGTPTAWLMPDIVETQALIWQTAEIIRSIKGATQ